MIGQLLDGRYRIIKELSSGGFGLTYLAEDSQRPGCPQCVVKQLRPPSNDPQTIQLARHLLETEAQTLERLGHYDQIPRLFAYFEDNQEFYIIEEFIPGHSLMQEILPGRPLPEAQVINILTQVLEILVFVHGQGVVHRDIKPANLMRRDTDGKIVLIDFGAVKEIATQVVNSQGNITSTVAVGTPSYMPIEQFHGKPQFSSDIYALGVVAIQALTGLLANDISKLRDPNNPSTGEIRWRHRTEVSPKLANIIDKMVRFDCRQRYQSAAQVLAELTALRNVIEKTQLSSGSYQHQPQRKPLWLAGAGAVALIVVGGGIWSLIAKTPNNVCETQNQGVEAIEKKDYKTAIVNFDQCIQLNPKDGQAHLYRGNAHLNLGEQDKAIEDYNQALEIFEQQKNFVGVGIRVEKRDNKLTVARVYYGTPALEAGVRIGDEILEIDGKSTNNMSQDDASNLINNGKMGSPVTVRFAHEGSNDFKRTLNRVAIADKLSARIYINRGLAWSAKGNNKAAFNDYNQSLKLNPNNSEVYYQRGGVRFNLKDEQGAIEDFNKAIQINSNYLEAYLGRGNVRSDLKDKQGAIHDYTKVIQNKSAPAYGPDYLNMLRATAYNSRGNVKYQSADKPGAIGDYTKAIQLNPDSELAFYNRGLAIAALGDKPGGIKDLQRAASLYLDHGDSDNYNKVRAKITSLQH